MNNNILPLYTAIINKHALEKKQRIRRTLRMFQKITDVTSMFFSCKM